MRETNAHSHWYLENYSMFEVSLSSPWCAQKFLNGRHLGNIWDTITINFRPKNNFGDWDFGKTRLDWRNPLLLQQNGALKAEGLQESVRNTISRKIQQDSRTRIICSFLDVYMYVIRISMIRELVWCFVGNAVKSRNIGLDCSLGKKSKELWRGEQERK